MRRLAIRFLGLALLAAFPAFADEPAPCLASDGLDLGNGFRLDLPRTVCVQRQTFESGDEFFRLRSKAGLDTLLLDVWAHRPARDPWLQKRTGEDSIVRAETLTALPFTLELAGARCQPLLHRGIPEGGDRPEARLDATVNCVREDGARTTDLLHLSHPDLSLEARTIADLVRTCESAGIPSLMAALPEDRTKVQ